MTLLRIRYCAHNNTCACVCVCVPTFYKCGMKPRVQLQLDATAELATAQAPVTPHLLRVPKIPAPVQAAGATHAGSHPQQPIPEATGSPSSMTAAEIPVAAGRCTRQQPYCRQPAEMVQRSIAGTAGTPPVRVNVITRPEHDRALARMHSSRFEGGCST